MSLFLSSSNDTHEEKNEGKKDLEFEAKMIVIDVDEDDHDGVPPKHCSSDERKNKGGLSKVCEIHNGLDIENSQIEHDVIVIDVDDDEDDMPPVHARNDGAQPNLCEVEKELEIENSLPIDSVLTSGGNDDECIGSSKKRKLQFVEKAQIVSATSESSHKETVDISSNIFARFASDSTSSLQLSKSKKRMGLDRWIQHSPTRTTERNILSNDSTIPTEVVTKTSSSQSKGTSRTSTSCREWVKLADLPPREQEKIIAKWHSMYDTDSLDTYAMEDRRFQIFVAARLHARCQETVVRNVMAGLRRSTTPFLTVTSMASANHEELIPYLKSLQYYRTKAKHLIQAANEMKTRFDGKVPEKEFQLRQLTGIGPILADLLAFVNTPAIHRKKVSGVSES